MSLEILEIDRLGGMLDQSPQSFFAFPQRLFRPPALGDVEYQQTDENSESEDDQNGNGHEGPEAFIGRLRQIDHDASRRQGVFLYPEFR